MKPLDYTLYNKVKAKFTPVPLAIIFVSLAPANLEKLDGIVFQFEEIGEFRGIVAEHADAVIPYAVIGSFEEDRSIFYLGCPEFEQEEDLLTGQIIASSIGTYHNRPIDIEAVKKDLRRLTDAMLFGGNA
jgi:hypothetical protein